MRIFITNPMDPARLNRRRFLFFSAVFVLTSLATWFVADLYWRDAAGLTGLEIALLVLFAPLFAHISVGFCTAFVGFYVINRGGDSSRITASLPSDGKPSLASTAVVMPIFNEYVSRVFEGSPCFCCSRRSLRTSPWVSARRSSAFTSSTAEATARG